MKSWPLRLKIALWSALVVGIALLVAGFAASQHFYYEDLELLDGLLQREVRGVFSELERIPADFDFDAQKLDRLLPAAFRHRRVEIRHGGRVVFRSGKEPPEMFGTEAQPVGNYSVGTDARLRLAIAERGPWQVRVAFETRQARDAIEELLRAFLLASPALLFITGFGGWWIARQALAPVQAVTQAAEEITAERLHQRLPVPPSRDEVQHLSLVLNRMIERLERSFHQAQRFSADTSHELRTPLAVLQAGLEAMLAARDLTPTQEQQLLDLLDASTQLSSLCEKLLLLARADAGFLQLQRSSFDLAALVREAMEEAAVFAEASQIQITSQLPGSLPFEADAGQLMQVLRNLLENAVKYNRRGGRVHVELTSLESSIRLAVTNTGTGFEADQVGKLFTRFYRAESHRHSPGHGLGLSISREVARAHGGTLTLVSFREDEIRFELALPMDSVPLENADDQSVMRSPSVRSSVKMQTAP